MNRMVMGMDMIRMNRIRANRMDKVTMIGIVMWCVVGSQDVLFGLWFLEHSLHSSVEQEMQCGMNEQSWQVLERKRFGGQEVQFVGEVEHSRQFISHGRHSPRDMKYEEMQRVQPFFVLCCGMQFVSVSKD